MIKLCAFIKIGQEQHIHDLYDNGTIYINIIARFKEIEDNFVRGDRYEGDYYVEQADFLKLYIKDKLIAFTKQTDDFNSQLYIEYQKTNGHIYSLYSLFTPEDSDKIIVDNRILDFGDTCLFIHNVDEFWNRLKSELEKNKLKFKYGFVKYYDYKTFIGRAGVFHKSNRFEYQNEFRVFIKDEIKNPLKILIGNLSDISKIFKSKDLLDIRIANE
jgi:hypothetical protein